MKYLLKIIVATAAVLAVSAGAQAQDGVSLFGRIDAGYAGVNATNSAGKQLGGVGFANSSMESSEWGIRGSEDLGEGNRAIFNLEGDITAGGTTVNNVLFRRQANIGLSSVDLGTVQLGTVYDSLAADAQGSILPVAGNSVNFSTQIPGGTGNYFPTQAIKYTLPRLFSGRVTGGFTYSSGNVPDQYGNGLLSGSMADGYLRVEPVKDLKLTAGYGVFTPVPSGYTLPTITLNGYVPYYTNVYGGNEYLLGASYKYGRYSIGAMFTSSSKVQQFTGAYPYAKVNTGSLGLGYQATERVKFGANYVHNSGSTSLYNAQVHYALSKRTDLYAQYNYVKEGYYATYAPVWYGDNVGSTAVSAPGINTVAQAFIVGTVVHF